MLERESSTSHITFWTLNALRRPHTVSMPASLCRAERDRDSVTPQARTAVRACRLSSMSSSLPCGDAIRTWRIPTIASSCVSVPEFTPYEPTDAAAFTTAPFALSVLPLAFW